MSQLQISINHSVLTSQERLELQGFRPFRIPDQVSSLVVLIIKNLWQGDLLTKGYRTTEVQLCKEDTKARTALFWRDLVGVLALAQTFGEELI